MNKGLNKWEEERKKGRSRMLGRKGRKHRLRKFEKCQEKILVEL